jgi:signal transduction histidine kinase
MHTHVQLARTNAEKEFPGHRIVTVDRVEYCGFGDIWLNLRQEWDEAVLSVRDRGVGINPELLPHIFDLFTQAQRSLDRSQAELGVGLTVVRKLVEMQRGTVEATAKAWATAVSSLCGSHC